MPEKTHDIGFSLLKSSAVNEQCLFSPFSIALALDILKHGTGGVTKKQLETLLGTDCNSDVYAKIMKELSLPSDVIMKITNHLLVNQGFPVKEKFSQDVDELYNAKALNLDFSNDETLETIKSIVSEATNGHLKLDMTQEQIKGKELMILSTMHLDAEWLDVFTKEDGGESEFFGLDGHQREVWYLRSDTSMGRADYHYYMENEELKALSIQYKEKAYRFTIILPKIQKETNDVLEAMVASASLVKKESKNPSNQWGDSSSNGSYRDSSEDEDSESDDRKSDEYDSNEEKDMPPCMSSEQFANFRNNMNGDKLKAIWSRMKIKQVDLSFPKMAYTSTVELKAQLALLGLSDLFSPSADLSGISDSALRVSSVIQQTRFDVDELGTRASTAVFVHLLGCGLSYPKTFQANRPFIFVLSKRETVLYIGQYV